MNTNPKQKVHRENRNGEGTTRREGTYYLLWTAGVNVVVVEIILEAGVAQDAGLAQNTAH